MPSKNLKNRKVKKYTTIPTKLHFYKCPVLADYMFFYLFIVVHVKGRNIIYRKKAQKFHPIPK